MRAEPLGHPPPPESDASDELRPAGAQEADEERDDGSARAISSQAQLQERQETHFNTQVAEPVPKLATDMVATFAEGLTEQVSSLTSAHENTDRKLDRPMASVSAMSGKMREQERRARRATTASRRPHGGAD